MWKDFFYFSKVQRRGIVVLITLIVLIVTLNLALPLFFPASDIDNTVFIEEVDEFKRNLLSRDSLRQLEQERLQAEREAQYSRRSAEPDYSLFPFNPNTVDSATFVKLGIRPNVAGNIVKYRNKGGKFKQSDDFRKIYGISDAKLQELMPYIQIPPEKEIELSEEKVTDKENVVEEFVVELNSADTTELMKIKGVGRFYAMEIVKYRRELGGFVTVEQLLEVRNMRPESFEKIAPFCIVDENRVDKINVNTASVDHMRRHPYINFYQAKTIYEYRKIRGRLSDIDELKRFDDFSADDLLKLKPYLNFD